MTRREERHMKGRVIVYIRRDAHQKCIIKEMTINGIPAHIHQFGHSKDIDPDNAPPNGCGNRVFVINRRLLRDPALKTCYHLSDQDIEDLATILKKALYIGECPQCR